MTMVGANAPTPDDELMSAIREAFNGNGAQGKTDIVLPDDLKNGIKQVRRYNRQSADKLEAEANFGPPNWDRVRESIAEILGKKR